MFCVRRGQKEKGVTMPVPQRLKVPVHAGDHAQGPPDASITLLEYGDYECPHCGRAYPTIKAVQRHFGDDLRFVYRHFPLVKIHPMAEPPPRLPNSSAHIADSGRCTTFVRESGRALSRITRSGVQGTPTFFINGEQHAGPYEFEDLVDAIQQHM
jgi:protein-disulfide isomerase